MIPETPGEIREVLAGLGRRPRRRFGQNFLADPNLRDAIVAAAGPRPGDLVLEVGPGLGTLTKGLLASGARVLAAEIDTDLADFLESELRGEPGFRLVRGDAMGKKRLADGLRAALEEERGGADRFLVVANLPYAISTPLLAALAGDEGAPERIVVMVQREVGERMTGRPGTGEYGPLAVLFALRGQARRLREVGGRVFCPPAPVRSAVVEVERRPVERADLVAGDRAARATFRHRRKTVRRALLAGGFAEEAVVRALSEAGADPADRPEVLSPEQFVSIGRALWPSDRQGPV